MNFQDQMKYHRILRYSFIIISCCQLASCKSNSGNSDDSNDALEIGNETEGGKTGVELVINDVGTVRKDIVPGALEISDAGLTTEGNPCEGKDFLSCQPDLLKLYINISKQMITMLESVITETSTTINSFNETSGEIEPDTDDITKISYNISSSKDYKILMHSKAGPFIYLAIDRKDDTKKYKMIFDRSNAPEDEEDDDGSGPNIFQMDLEYTGKTDFEAKVILAGMPCSDDDVRAPAAFYVTIMRSEDGHFGKAVTYSPRLLTKDSATCSTDISTASEAAIMTDFAGDDAGATAKIYIGNSSTTESNLNTWQLSQFCTRFASSCQNGKAFGSSSVISAYENPVCIGTDDATWGEECSGYATGDFSSAEKWLFPSELKELEIEIPKTP